MPGCCGAWHPGRTRRRGAGPDVVLVSHLHHDHAELRSLRMLRGAVLMSAPANTDWLRRRTQMHAVPLGDGWSQVGSGVEIRQVPADHGQRPMLHRPNDANGQLVRGPSGVVWIAGDTGLYPDMAALPAMAGGSIDVALVPVWGWGPKLSGGHLTPETAARAVAASGARFAVPVHWGTLHPPFVNHFARSWLEMPGRRFATRRGGAGSRLLGRRSRPRPVLGYAVVSRSRPGPHFQPFRLPG